MPLFHVTGCSSQLLAIARLGGTAVIMPTLNLNLLIATLTAERVSLMVTVPAVYALLLRHKDFAKTDVSGVGWVCYGGAPIAPSLVRAVKNALPQAMVFNGYGITESASLMTVLPDRDVIDNADSVGYAVPSEDLGLVPNGDDPRVGEWVARGANLTAVYWNRAAGHRGDHRRRRLAAYRRCGAGRRRGPRTHRRPAQGHHQSRR